MDDRLRFLFDTYEDKLDRLGRRLTPSADDAHDLVQDTFVRAAQSLRSIPDGPQEYAWLVRVLINLRRDQWRKAAIRARSAPYVVHPSTSSATPESALIAKRAIWTALDALAPRRRAIVVLAEIDGMNRDEIAALLGVTVMTVRWHLSMARRELKQTLAEYLGDRHEDVVRSTPRRRSAAR
ncbi:MAG TPA: sigma-70 family RNA polymerase sigma factor [Vicinamibacterales bacterium]|nr:sigma-70 family RNA polymerase sigma factor [Vicinamibacterales bacterium]